jgi:hypothetical protein
MAHRPAPAIRLESGQVYPPPGIIFDQKPDASSKPLSITASLSQPNRTAGLSTGITTPLQNPGARPDHPLTWQVSLSKNVTGPDFTPYAIPISRNPGNGHLIKYFYF